MNIAEIFNFLTRLIIVVVYNIFEIVRMMQQFSKSNHLGSMPTAAKYNDQFGFSCHSFFLRCSKTGFDHAFCMIVRLRFSKAKLSNTFKESRNIIIYISNLFSRVLDI